MTNAVIDPGYRPLGLETDLRNQNFSGARNPDDLLWVQFAMKPIQNNYRTQREGRPVFEDQLWIEIRTPGGLNIIERPAAEEDKVRFARHWAFYQQTHGAEGQQIGTPLAQWPLLRPSQIEELRALKFYTVEQVAAASDEQLGRLGMLAGMAPMAFRERARLYLESARDNALAQKQEEEKRALQEQLAAERKAREEQAAKHEAEMMELRALITQATAAPQKRRGRPPKAEAA